MFLRITGIGDGFFKTIYSHLSEWVLSTHLVVEIHRYTIIIIIIIMMMIMIIMIITVRIIIIIVIITVTKGADRCFLFFSEFCVHKKREIRGSLKIPWDHHAAIYGEEWRSWMIGGLLLAAICRDNH